tara:strand:+ start:145 stop:1125 length:981 start_codon:yes stop_codon:yes gene_type:complete
MSITIGNVTKRIKSNKQNIKIKLNVNSEYEQNNIIKKRIKQNTDVLKKDDSHSDDNSKGDIMYNDSEVINIPKKLDDLFDNLLCDNYYLYGISINNVSFLNSLLYILLSEFKFKNSKDQQQFSIQLKINLLKELPIYFKNNKYSKLNFKKQNIEDNIENNLFENAELHYLSDYYSINIIVLDYYKFTYYTGGTYNEDNNNIIIVKYNEIYIPMIHIFGEFPTNLIYKCIINKLKINNLTSISNTNDTNNTNDINDTNNNNDTNEILEKETSSNDSIVSNSQKLKLKAFSAYKLSDLQELSEKYNISTINDSNKKKTKKQLYDELVL